jgi:hypothetical protein
LRPPVGGQFTIRPAARLPSRGVGSSVHAVGFETLLVDALYVNWAVPRAELPAPPAPLALDCAVDGDAPCGFVTLVLFRQRGLHTTQLPFVRLEFPQCNLRLPVRDADRVASVWLVRQLVPAWVVPLGRLVARQPVSGAVLRVADVAGDPCDQRWEIAAGLPLAIRARPGAPAVAGPHFGGWEQLVAFFRERPRGYVASGERLRRIEATFDHAAGIPCRAEIERDDWLRARLPEVAPERWSTPHSAFVVPATRLELERSKVSSEVAAAVPAPSVPA